MLHLCFPSFPPSLSIYLYVSLSLFPVGGYFLFVTDYLKHLHPVIPLQTNSDIDLIETLIIIDRKKKERGRERERRRFFLISSLCRTRTWSCELFRIKFSTKDNIEKLARIPVFVKHQNVFSPDLTCGIYFSIVTPTR